MFSEKKSIEKYWANGLQREHLRIERHWIFVKLKLSIATCDPVFNIEQFNLLGELPRRLSVTAFRTSEDAETADSVVKPATSFQSIEAHIRSIMGVTANQTTN